MISEKPFLKTCFRKDISEIKFVFQKKNFEINQNFKKKIISEKYFPKFFPENDLRQLIPKREITFSPNPSPSITTPIPKCTTKTPNNPPTTTATHP